MLNCNDVTHLVSQSLDRRLGWRERMGVRLHLLMCKGCARFARQIRFLRIAARRLTQRDPQASEALSDPARERIARVLRNG